MKICMTCNKEKKIEEFKLTDNKWRTKNCAECLNKKYYHSTNELIKYQRTKKCKVCERRKMRSGFYRSGRYLSSLCRQCTSIKRKKDSADKAIKELNEMKAKRKRI